MKEGRKEEREEEKEEEEEVVVEEEEEMGEYWNYNWIHRIIDINGSSSAVVWLAESPG